MKRLTDHVTKFLKEEREDGVAAVEYAVMLALIVVVCITAITMLGENTNKTFTMGNPQPDPAPSPPST